MPDLLRFYSNVQTELQNCSAYFKDALLARKVNTSNAALTPQAVAPLFSVFSPPSFSHPPTREFMLHFGDSLQQAPVLANFFECWCSSHNIHSWCQVAVQHVSDFSVWLCSEAYFFTSSTAHGWEYGILRGAWANALHKTFAIGTDTSGFGALSPFSNCLTGDIPESASIVCSSFSLHDETQPQHQQSLILRDLMLQLDKNPSQRQFFWFPSGIDPCDLWAHHFPRLHCVSFRCLVHAAKGHEVFSNCPKSLKGMFSLWSLAPPELPAWPTTPSTIHPLWSVSKAADGSIRLPTASFADAS